MNNRAAWAYLSRVVEGPSKPLHAHLNAGRSAEELAHGIRHRASWLADLGPATQARYTWDRAHQDLEITERLGGRLITPEDEEWPREQLDLAFGFVSSGLSEHLRSHQADAAPPHALWVRGGHLGPLLNQAVGVVGTRAATAYGREVTRLFGSGFAAHRWTVVSGGAKGIDTIAHETALARGGATIAIQACGLDNTYPRDNADMFQRIVGADSAVITEYPPGTTPQRHRFLTRNRLVAALTHGTVLIQAPWRSGALNTMTWCEGLGRTAMAVPGPVTTRDFSGNHARIKDGRAQLVTNPDEVRALLSAVGTLDANEQYELAFAPDEVQSLSRTELRIYDALPVSAGKDADRIALDAGIHLHQTVAALVGLTRRGLVTREGEVWRRTKRD